MNKFWNNLTETFKNIKNNDGFFEKVNDIWVESKFDGKFDHTMYFYGTDSLDNYDKNGNKTYSKTDVCYHINEYGYRIPLKTNFVKDEKPIIACFGCSQTRGVGLPWEQTWPYFLDKQLDFKYSVKNYGIDGASSDTISRLVYNYTLNNNPVAIFCLLPDIYRRELYHSNPDYIFPTNYYRFTEDLEENIEKTLAECEKYNFNVWDWRAYKQLSNEENGVYNYIKNIKFIELIAKTKNIPLCIFTWHEFFMHFIQMGKFKSESMGKLTKEQYSYLTTDYFKIEKARDNLHYGKKPNSIYADVFYRHIKDKIC